MILRSVGELLDFFAPTPNPVEYHGASSWMIESEERSELILRSDYNVRAYGQVMFDLTSER